MCWLWRIPEDILTKLKQLFYIIITVLKRQKSMKKFSPLDIEDSNLDFVDSNLEFADSNLDFADSNLDFAVD